MTWELRGGTRYYRSVRLGTKVHRIYLGSGEAARQAAEKDAAKKARRSQDQAEVAALQAAVAGADRLMAEVHEGLTILTEAVLLAQGFHQHHGEWRRRKDVDLSSG